MESFSLTPGPLLFECKSLPFLLGPLLFECKSLSFLPGPLVFECNLFSSSKDYYGSNAISSFDRTTTVRMLSFTLLLGQQFPQPEQLYSSSKEILSSPARVSIVRWCIFLTARTNIQSRNTISPPVRKIMVWMQSFPLLPGPQQFQALLYFLAGPLRICSLNVILSTSTRTPTVPGIA